MSSFTYKQMLAMLKQYLGDNAEFRDGQWDAIDSIVNHKSKLLLLQKTGWGKSYIYFIGTSLLRKSGCGVTVVISPLLSLMRNQIESAKKFNLHAVTMNSSNHEEWKGITRSLRQNKVDILFISPERLTNNNFIKNVMSKLCEHIGMLVIDEVHCISNWGHDFRPDYMLVPRLIRHLSENVPIIACTATANERVLADIKEQLDLDLTLKGSLIRENLSVNVTQFIDIETRLTWLVTYVSSVAGSGIIYVLSKKVATMLTEWFISNGINAKKYYSGLEEEDYESRSILENMLLDGSIKVLIATKSLGMGFDKSDVRFVINYGLPESMLTYYQQIGRAGRDGAPSYATLIPDIKESSKVHQFFRITSLKSSNYSDEIKRFNEHKIEEYNEMLAYVISSSCRTSTIMKHLDSEHIQDLYSCGICDNCSDTNIYDMETIPNNMLEDVIDFIDNKDTNKKRKQQENLNKGLSMNYGFQWTSREEKKLLELFEENVDIKEIAIAHHRSTKAILSKLKKLGRIKWDKTLKKNVKIE